MKIMIDAGHGLSTAGKRSPDGSMREHEFNNAVAKYVAAELKTYVNIITDFSHDPSGIRDVPLKERTDKANKWGADCFVSIHANALTGNWHSGGGIESFVYTTRPAEAVKLANNIQTLIIKATGLTNRGVKMADFHVLRETNMTAVLVECGFMDNLADLTMLKSDAYRRKCASAIAQGIAKTYNLEKKPTPVKPTPTKPTQNNNPSQTRNLYRVQIGAFANKANADAEAAKAKKAGYAPYIKQEGNLFKVQIGAFAEKANADTLAAALKSKGFTVYIS